MSRFIFVLRRLNEFSSVRSQLAVLAALLAVSMVSGCTDVAPTSPAQSAASSPARNSSLPPAVPIGPAVAQVPEAQPSAAVPEQTPAPTAAPGQNESAENSEQAQPRKTLGKTTKEVRDAEKEEAKGAKKVQPRITGQDPISISGSAYAAIVGRIEQLQIEDALNKFKAINERYPKDYPEFKREIIDGYRIRLAQLPFYQEYGYDAPNHKLVILEYPDKKKLATGGK